MNLRLRRNELEKLSENLDETEANYDACHQTIDDLVVLEQTPAERKELLNRLKESELVKYGRELEQYKQVRAEQREVFDKLEHDVKDYDSLLKEVALDIVCEFIDRSAQLYLKVSEARKAIAALDSGVDMLKINIGEVDLSQACQEFVDQKEELIKEFMDLNHKAQLLEANCKEYEEYASDKEEREIISTTKMAIGAFRKTVSVKQSQQIDQRVQRLLVLKRDFEIALNKQVIKKEGLTLIGEVEKLLAKQTETVEQSWKSLEKKAQHFHNFDLSYKIEKRGRLQTDCETLAA